MNSPKQQGRRLTLDQIRRIKQARIAGASIRAIAKRFGIAKSTVEKYLRRSE